MADHPYAIIVYADSVEERVLADHDAGRVITPSVQVLSRVDAGGIRTVKLQRKIAGLTADHYSFNLNTGTIPFISALGQNAFFGYHQNRTASQLYMIDQTGTPSCVCVGAYGTLDGIPFYNKCLPEPWGQLLTSNNTICNLETYQGGVQCCRHGTFLLDKAQTIPTVVDEVQLKLRVYFETYNASRHRSLMRLYWQTEAWVGEYDIEQCAAGTPVEQCVSTMTSHFTFADTMNGLNSPINPPAHCDSKTDPWCADKSLVTANGVSLIYAAAHCHSGGGCISLDLINDDTGELICRNTAVMGTSEQVYDEKGYIQLPPCLWGGEGLPSPPVLHLSTRLTSIVRMNNTYEHLGHMSMWQMRAVYN